jgi:3',5'-cyclic AMP phosphodiesterase CpdA
MSDLWQPLEAGEFAVAHLSDPHFGSDNADPVWEHVHDFLIDTLRPKLLLVTGDLVDTPNEEFYHHARRELDILKDALRVDYFVCAGNHDRHRLGNRITPEFLRASDWLRRATRLVQAAIWVLGIGTAALFFGTGWAHSSGSLAGAGIAALVLVAACSLALWRLPSYVGRQFDVGYTSNVFDNVFQHHILAPGKATRYKLGEGLEAWSLGLLGLDSSQHPDCFARGRIDSDQLRALASGATVPGRASAQAGEEYDLCVLLVHHHLLSIRRLEPGDNDVVSDLSLLNATCLVNASTVLERLAEARVDLVLHGHEHKHNWATYSSQERGYSSVRVVAAGSATGNDSSEGCQANNATLNVLIFKPDRSVRLRRAFYEEQTWKQDADVVLFGPEDVRQARVRRRAMRDALGKLAPQAHITSEIVKTSIFTRERDIEVSLTFTNWLFVDPHFVHPVMNSTGEPVGSSADRLPEVVLAVPDVTDPTQRRRMKVPGAEFVKVKADHTWVLRFDVPPRLLGRSVDIIVSYRWKHGGLLTSEELAMIKGSPAAPRALGFPRNQDMEFGTVWTNGQPVAALELHVSVPPEYAPRDRDVRVYVHDEFQTGQEQDKHFLKEGDALRARVRTLSNGRYSLRIPFPRVSCSYTLAWSPVTEAVASARLQNEQYTALFAQMDGARAARALRAFGRVFRGTPLWGKATLALFVYPACAAAVEYREGIHLVAPGCPPLHELPPLDTIDFKSERNLLVQAWWGSLVSERRPARDAEARELGFLPHEGMLLCVPVRLGLSATAPPPWAIVRIGVWQEGMDLLGQDADGTIENLLRVGVARLLAVALVA